MKSPNHRPALDAATATSLRFENHWRGASEAERWQHYAMTRYYVTAPKPRPDFRLVITFLWHDGQNVDTEGDCEHPASNDWTELYIANREQPTEPSVSVSAHQQSPLILAVESESEHTAARAAYFLAVSVGSSPE